MSRAFSQVISYLFHPVFISFIALVLIYFLNILPGFHRYVIDENRPIILLTFGLVFIFSAFLPTVFILILRKRGVIESIELMNREDRMMPFFGTLVFYTILSYLALNWLGNAIPFILIFFFIGANLSVFFAFMISLFWKISIHMMGIGGLVGMISVLIAVHDLPFYWLYITLFVAGLVGYSRLDLKAHTLLQVLMGFLLGWCCEGFLLLWI